MQGKIVKILGLMNRRIEVPRRRVLVALLSTEDSNDSQKRMRAVLTIHPTLAYPFFHPISPCLVQGGQI